MKIVHVDIPEDHGYLIPIGDLHRGDKHFTNVGLRKLTGYLEWVKEHKNARIFLMGDILNVASRSSKTNPFESDSDEYVKALKLFLPYKSQIIGAISGNHCARMYKEFGFNPLGPFCSELGVPFLNFSSAIHLRVGKCPSGPKTKNKGEFYQSYWGYAHHGTGGGGTLGSALNRKVKLADIVQGMDFYMAGHDHQLVTGVREVYVPKNKELQRQRVHYIDTGSFLDWDDSYAEEAMMPIGKLGSPRIRFDGRCRHHDVHVSL